jgi:hypothetical protein
MFESQEVIIASEHSARVTAWKPPFDASESPIGLVESSSLSSDSPREVKPIRFLPVNYSPSRHDSRVAHDNNRELSPCSRLAQRWIQTKEKRRVSRKVHPRNGARNMVQPSLVEALYKKDESNSTGTVNMVDGNGLARNAPTLAHDPNAIEVIRESKAPPLVCHSVEHQVTIPEIVSDESFFQDYWGE